MKMKFYILLSALLISMIITGFICHAQTPEWQWADAAGGNNWDFGNDVATDHLGNVYVTGYFSSSSITFGSTTFSNSGVSPYEDIFIVKYDALGNVLWAQQAGGTLSDNGRSIATDADGNVYVAGYFRSSAITFGGITLTLSGDYNIFLVKYNSEGIVQWAKKASTIAPNYAYNDCYGLAADADGNIYLSGMFQGSSITFGSIVLSNSNTNGTGDMFVAKYDASGNAMWASNATGSEEDGCQGMAIDIAGNVIVSGFFRSSSLDFGSDALENSGSTDHPDLFIAKYDADGNVIWINQAGGNHDDYGRDIATDGNGNIYMTGEFYSNQITFDNITIDNNLSGGYADLFLVKYNGSGIAQWAQKAYCTNYDYSFGVAVDTNDNAYITGWFDYAITFGTTTLSSASSSDIFIAKYDTSGNFVWVVQGSGNGPDYSYKIALDPNNNAYITGGFASESLNFGNVSILNSYYVNSPYYYDMHVAKYGTDCASLYFADNDHDLFGDADSWIASCVPPKGYVNDSTDCDDTNAAAYPGAIEIPNNGIDEDCNGEDEVTVSVAGLNKDQFQLLIFPNPANHHFSIYLKGNNDYTGKATIGLFNIFGQNIYEKNIYVMNGELTHEIYLDEYVSSGMYSIRITAQNTVYHTRIICQE